MSLQSQQEPSVKGSQKIRNIVVLLNTIVLASFICFIVFLLKIGWVDCALATLAVTVFGQLWAFLVADPWRDFFASIYTSCAKKCALLSKKADILVTYIMADRFWAKWIEWQLKENGYKVILHHWNGNNDFIKGVNRKAQKVKMISAILSNEYLHAITEDKTEDHKLENEKYLKDIRAFIVVRQRAYEKLKTIPILDGIKPIDLTNLKDSDSDTASNRLIIPHISGVCGPRNDQTSRLNSDDHSSKTDRNDQTLPSDSDDHSHSLQIEDHGGPPFPGSLPEYSNVPSRNIYFTGRETIIDELSSKFQSGTSKVILQGLMAIGKTEIAKEYAHSNYDRYHYQLWLSMSSPEGFDTSLQEISKHFWPALNNQNTQEMETTIINWLAKNSDWLLILDGCTTSAQIDKFSPKTPKGHILVTADVKIRDNTASNIDIHEMNLDEGIVFLFRQIYEKDVNTASNAKVLEKNIEKKEAKTIVSLLGRLPAALSLAGQYIRETSGDEDQCPLKSYRELYQRESHRLEDMYKKILPVGCQLPVVYTWFLSFEQVQQTMPAAAKLLQFCAFLHHEAISYDIIRNAATPSSAFAQIPTDKIEFNDLIIELRKFSLISDAHTPSKHLKDEYTVLQRQVRSESLTFSINPHVQNMLKHSIDLATQKRLAEYAVLAIGKSFPVVEMNTMQHCRQYELHAQICEDHIKEFQFNLERPEIAQLYDRCGCYLRDCAHYDRAEHFLQKGLEIREKLFQQDPTKENHLDLAISKNNLADLYYTQGNFTNAESFYKMVQTIRKQYLPVNHQDKDIAMVCSSLATLYDILKRPNDAEQSRSEALAIWAKLQQPNSRLSISDEISMYKRQADIYGQDAKVYSNDRQKKYAEAEASYQQAIEKCELGSLEKALCEAALAQFKISCRKQKPISMKDCEDAAIKYRWALRMCEDILEESNPQVARILGNLAELHVAQIELSKKHHNRQDDYSQAISCYDRAIKIYTDKLKLPKHPQLEYFKECKRSLERDYPKLKRQHEKEQ